MCCHGAFPERRMNTVELMMNITTNAIPRPTAHHPCRVPGLFRKAELELAIISTSDLKQGRFSLAKPNGVAHLPLTIARQLTLKTTFSTKWPPRTRAEGGQVEPVLGSFLGWMVSCFQLPFFSFWCQNQYACVEGHY